MAGSAEATKPAVYVVKDGDARGDRAFRPRIAVHQLGLRTTAARSLLRPTVYTQAPDVVMRCRSRDAVLMVLVNDGVNVSAHQVAIALPDPEPHRTRPVVERLTPRTMTATGRWCRGVHICD
jgi:hypothetical protein